MLGERVILRLIDILANKKMNEITDFEIVNTQDDMIRLLRVKCQYDAIDALNEILQAHKIDESKFYDLVDNIEKGNYKTNRPEIDKQLRRLGFE